MVHAATDTTPATARERPEPVGDAVYSRANTAYDWGVSAKIAGQWRQRSVGINGDYDQARTNVTDALNDLPVNVEGVGTIRRTHPGSHLPCATVARAGRDTAGEITWTQV